MKDKPYLSLQLRTFASEEPESWSPVIDQAVAADRAGIGKVVVSDHVVFGENLDAYADPTLGGLSGGKQPTVHACARQARVSHRRANHPRDEQDCSCQ